MLTINEHLKILYVDGEIQVVATLMKFLIVRRGAVNTAQFPQSLDGV